MGKNAKRRREEKEARRFDRYGPKPGPNLDGDPLSTLSPREDFRSFEEWQAEVEARLPPCPECGGTYLTDDVDGEEWFSDVGEGETLIYWCEGAFDSEGELNPGDQLHPQTRGMLEVSRTLRAFPDID